MKWKKDVEGVTGIIYSSTRTNKRVEKIYCCLILLMKNLSMKAFEK